MTDSQPDKHIHPLLHDLWKGRAYDCHDCIQREEEREADKERIRFLLTLMPPWVEEVPDGLDPTFYGTLSAAGDREVKAKVDAIRAAIESTEKQEGRR